MTSNLRERLFREAVDLRGDAARFKRITRLHADATRATLGLAVRACRSDDPRERQAGAAVLGQLGFAAGMPFWRQSFPVLVRLLRKDEDPRVIQAAIIALGHLARQHRAGMRRAVAPLCVMVNHRDADVRHALAHALPNFGKAAHVIEMLILLTRDRSSDVRNWACFGLGTVVTLDAPRVREALWNRVGDRDLDTHWEAVAGLAKRHDLRVRRQVLDALRSGMSGVLDNVWSTVIEAAPGYRDAEICEALRRLADQGWVVSRAVAECDAAVSNEGRP